MCVYKKYFKLGAMFSLVTKKISIGDGCEYETKLFDTHFARQSTNKLGKESFILNFIKSNWRASVLVLLCVVWRTRSFTK